MGVMTRTEEQERIMREGTFAEGVAAEIEAQDAFWGKPADSIMTWQGWFWVLDGEYSEMKAALRAVDQETGDLQHLRHELIQVAAICAQMSLIVDLEMEYQKE